MHRRQPKRPSHEDRQDRGPGTLENVRHTGTPGGSRERLCRATIIGWRTPAAVCGLLLVAIATVFGQTLSHGFVNYDDDQYIFENRFVSHGLTVEGAAWALTTNHAGNWHPVTWFSHMVDCQVYGLNAGGHHLTNVILHASAAMLLFLVLWRMTGRCWPSAFVAAVFAIHPLRVESVAWLSERKDLLSGLFFMLTLGAYVAYVRRPFSVARYLAVMLLFAFGLMAKPMLVTLPCVLLLLDYWPLVSQRAEVRDQKADIRSPTSDRPLLSRFVLDKLPLFAMSAASCLVTLHAQRPAVLSLDFVPLFARIGNALVAYVAYLGQFFYPTGLAILYPHQSSTLPVWKAVGALIIFAGITAAAIATRRRCPYFFVGWLWYVGMLVPVIGLVQVGGQSMADRYTYLPAIGVAIAVAFGAAELAVALSCRRLLGAAAAAVVLVLTVAAWRQTTFWRDSESLWRHTIACSDPNPVAHHNLGEVLLRRDDLDGAMREFMAALQINPNYATAANNIGVIFRQRGRPRDAAEYYRRALMADENCADAHMNLGNILADDGQKDQAVAEYRKSIELFGDGRALYGKDGESTGGNSPDVSSLWALDPHTADAHNSLANVLAQRGQLEAAQFHYLRALEIRPAFAEAHHNLASLLAQSGKLGDAVSHYREALEIRPDYAAARLRLGTALYRQGQAAAAIEQWRQLLRTEPENSAALNELAWVLATSSQASLRNGAEAVEFGQRAAKLTGERDAAVLDTLAAAYAESGRFVEAVEVARRAIDMAARANQGSLADDIKARLLLYQANKPFRDPSDRAAAPDPPQSSRHVRD